MSDLVERPVLIPARRLAAPIILGFLLIAIAWYVRRSYIEPEQIAFACDTNPWVGWCAARMLAIQTFVTMGLGWVAIVSGGMAVCFGSRAMAWIAWLVGCLGLVWYCYEFAAVGALAGLTVLVRKLSQR